jgi:hypothetical protein
MLHVFCCYHITRLTLPTLHRYTRAAVWPACWPGSPAVVVTTSSSIYQSVAATAGAVDALLDLVHV